MGLHHITWRATASALTNHEVVAEAMAWLIGDPDAVQLERSTSYHGSELWMVTAHSKKKSFAMKSLAQLGVENLQVLHDTLEQRFDEDHVLYLRLNLDDLISSKISLADSSRTGTVKGQAKIEVYPGQDALEQARTTLQDAIEAAQKKN
ncbi:MAG: hypothetical protein ISP83_01170 [Candidatus Poseidonia sp.]|nr:hypothetical protein [Poseidonia sp.]MBL6748455.1 hypothetical protein [Poseidonia sp.]MBL6806433.1 hypothetical protein [Poseidonia sp.]MBL6886713.1 hypothetical protein [Poseidonia sp.]MBL6892369.1 hypothetical protein [Poseidonia sp.]